MYTPKAPLHTHTNTHTYAHTNVHMHAHLYTHRDVVSDYNLVQVGTKAADVSLSPSRHPGLVPPISPASSNYTVHGCDELQTKHL